MRIAAFDFGSNALKCLIANVTPKRLSFLQDVRIQTRLGSSESSTGNLSFQTINSTVSAVRFIQGTILSDLEVDECVAVGTQALRTAKNSKAFIRKLKRDTDISLKVISTEEEAQLSWEGAISGFKKPSQPVTLFDSGGSSTEIVQGQGKQIEQSISLPVGAVNLATCYIFNDPPTDYELKVLTSVLEDIKISLNPKGNLIGLGGGIVACAKLLYGKDPDDYYDLDGYSIKLANISALLNQLAPLSIEQKDELPGMETDRSDIIVPALILYKTLMEKLGYQKLQVCIRGLRHGLIQRYWDNQKA